MTRTFTILAFSFAALELLDCYTQYLDMEAKQFKDAMTPGVFKGWALVAHSPEMAPAKRLVMYLLPTTN